ncbi:MAG: hypothetical protein EOM00_12780 [Clostridia bacterium]|nr:hypothetical protein [Clostridia bacterium]
MQESLMEKNVNRENILLLNHHGLGEVMMSLPACRWLVQECGERVWMTVAGDEEQICSDQRCGSHFVPFSITNKRLYSKFKLIMKIRGLGIESVVAFDGFDRAVVHKFSRLIGAKRFYCESVCDADIMDRNAVHKRFRYLQNISVFLGKPVPPEIEDDYLLDACSRFHTDFLNIYGRYIVLVPGSGEMERFKRWPIDQFVDFSKLCNEKDPEIKLVITGTSNEYHLGNSIQNEVHNSSVINLCGKVSLKDLVPLYKQSMLVVGGDCGGLHLAKASGARIAVIIGPTNYAFTGPIEADIVMDRELPGTPWYCRENVKKKAYLTDEPSMKIPAADLMKCIEDKGIFD